MEGSGPCCWVCVQFGAKYLFGGDGLCCENMYVHNVGTWIAPNVSACLIQNIEKNYVIGFGVSR